MADTAIDTGAYRGIAMPQARRAAILNPTPGAAVTTPAFQQPGDPGQPKPATKRARLSPNTGDCPECGATDLPMYGRSLTVHPERRIRRGPGGLAEEFDGDTTCPGSHGRAEPGTVHRAETPSEHGKASR